MVIQWGSATTGTGKDITSTFILSFSTIFFGLSTANDNTPGAAATVSNWCTIDLTNITIHRNSTGNNFYLAFGM